MPERGQCVAWRRRQDRAAGDQRVRVPVPSNLPLSPIATAAFMCVGSVAVMNFGIPASIPTDPTFWRLDEPGFGSTAGYRAAIVCKRGHARDVDLIKAPSGDLGYCSQCGARMIGRCPSCEKRIRGRMYDPDVLYVVDDVFQPEPFCDACGEPHPWADRAARVHQLENLLDEEDLDEATRLLVSEDLRRIRDGAELGDKEQAELWKRVKTRAPGLLTGAAGRITESLITAYVKKQIGA